MIARHPQRALLSCGLISLAIYICAFSAPYSLYPLVRRGVAPDLGAITGYAPAACALYVSSLTLLFGLYGLAIYASRFVAGAPAPRLPINPSPSWGGARGAVLLVIVLALAMALVLTQVYPFAASDVFLYIVHGRTLGIYGQNPMAVSPSMFPTAPYLPFDSEWVNDPSPYGPLWQWTAAGLARLGDGSLLRSLLVFKGFALLGYMGCVLLVLAILRTRRDNALKALIAFAWNPLVLIETHVMGHNDLYMVFFVLLALWFWERRQYVWVLVALAAGGLVKYVPFILLPPTLLLMRQHLSRGAYWRSLALGTCLSLVLTALAFASLWAGGAALEVTRQMSRVHTSVGAWLIIALDMLWPQGPAFDIGLWAVRASFATAYVVILWQALRRDLPPALEYHRVLYAWLALAAVAFGYWYIVWLIALLPFITMRETWLRSIIFSWCGLISVALYTFGHELGMQLVYLVTVPFVFGVPLVLARWFDRRLRHVTY